MMDFWGFLHEGRRVVEEVDHARGDFVHPGGVCLRVWCVV